MRKYWYAAVSSLTRLNFCDHEIKNEPHFFLLKKKILAEFYCNICSGKNRNINLSQIYILAHFFSFHYTIPNLTKPGMKLNCSLLLSFKFGRVKLPQPSSTLKFLLVERTKELCPGSRKKKNRYLETQCFKLGETSFYTSMDISWSKWSERGPAQCYRCGAIIEKPNQNKTPHR